MAIATVDDIAAGLASGIQYAFLKNFATAKGAGAYQSGWLAAGLPGAGVASPVYTAGSGYTCDRTTTGALGQTNGSTQNWIARLVASANVASSIIIYDRLWSCSGMGFAASTYSVTTPGSLPARITDGGVGVEAFVEQFVVAGAASGTLTLNYTNSSGITGHSGAISAVVSAPVVGQIQPIPLQAGDVGVQQVVSAVNSATWTSGSFGITLAKRIATIPLPIAGVATSADWASVLTKIPADACLWFVAHLSSATAVVLAGSTSIIDK